MHGLGKFCASTKRILPWTEQLIHRTVHMGFCKSLCYTWSIFLLLYCTVWCNSWFYWSLFFWREYFSGSKKMFKYRYLLLRLSPGVSHSILTSTRMFKDYCIHAKEWICHLAREVMALLRADFRNDRVISRTFPITWLPRSPDMNHCNF